MNLYRGVFKKESLWKSLWRLYGNLYGIFMETEKSLWSLYRNLYGVFMESLWNLHGVSMEEDGVCEKLNCLLENVFLWQYVFLPI